jgi:ActR/RegA family two-component response regulator
MSGSESILHVEDDKLVARSLRRWLERRGFVVTSVGTCAEAQACKTNPVCGVFDIDLPDGDGIQLAAKLLEQAQVQRAVFYTATCDAEAMARAAALGPVVSKGGNLENLLRALTNAGTTAEHAAAPDSGIGGPPSPKASTG